MTTTRTWRAALAGLATIVLCSGCGPSLRASLTQPEQGAESGGYCAMAQTWEAHDRPSIRATVVSDCATDTEGPLRVTVISRGSVVSEATVDARLRPNTPLVIETPGFPLEATSDPITVEFTTVCEGRSMAARATCTVKDPPAPWGTQKDPPAPGTQDP